MWEEEIENDISPKEINSMTGHEVIRDYMLNVSDLLNKTVALTIEKGPDELLAIAENGQFLLVN
jgi:hypothetical protein